MLRALGVVVLTCCLPLFLVALQAQDAQSAPMQGQGADVAKKRPLPAPEPDSMLIPSWYLKEMEPKPVQKETFQMGESDRVPVSGEERQAVPDTSTSDVAKGRPLPAPEPDSMLIPSWYLKVKDSQKIPVVPKELLRALEKAASEMEPETVQKETFQMGERDRVPVLGEGEAIQGTKTPAQPQGHPGRSASLGKDETAQELSKNYILGTAAAFSVLLLGIAVGCIVMSQLMRDTRTQGDEASPVQADTYSA
ncbi:uncharacterized protein LOC116780874 isoform X1 [Chiroxiphia lanceolata]|uniref:uncharacterized protein LOC116780874 isoform X1 n=1 Tax=Chiroxiphia lanceolata TaxID=296741 RepID=UPI0013CF0C22|nr:uncharacterized protein LOC116780874 isoform X1 [Chiroxiphia lanceolata]